MTIHIGQLQENLKFYTTYKKNATGEFPKLDGKITIRILIKMQQTYHLWPNKYGQHKQQQQKQCQPKKL
jgi:hypothetical protein